MVSACVNRGIIAAAIASLIAGTALSHVIEPGVRVEKVTLAGNTPSIRLSPSSPGPHPIALLAHGATASKETLFRFGEALSAAGFDCFTVDLPGHGASRQSFSIRKVVHTPAEVARALESVDVFLGHSMGAAVGAWSVREAGFRPKLFIGVGANPDLGEQGPPLMLLAGWFEEFIRPAQLKARTNAQVVISPWCDHVLEPFDPHLVNAAVRAACGAMGKTPPAAPTAWLWRFAGLLLGMAGALALLFSLPELHPQLARARGFVAPVITIIAFVLTTGTWIGAAPHLHRIPVQLALLVVIWLALAGLGRLRMPRWSLAVVSGLLALGCLAIAYATDIFPFAILMATLGMSTPLLLASAVVGRIAARGGSRKDGDIAMAVFASYAIGLFIPQFL